MSRLGRPPIKVKEGNRWCSFHKQEHPISEFTNGERACKLGKYQYHIKRTYGLEQEIFDNLIVDQNGLCAICKTNECVYVDHNHETGKVRGLLCPSCNTAIGLLKEDPKLFYAALGYLGNE